MFVAEGLSSATIEVPNGLPGVAETVAAMIRLAATGAREPIVRETAEEIVRNLPARDWRREVRAVEAWVRRRLRYTRDGLDVETLKTPARMIREIGERGRFLGDCDDASILIASLLLALGHRPSFQVLGRGRTPHHVNILERGTGAVLDPTGEPAGAFAYRRVYDVFPFPA